MDYLWLAVGAALMLMELFLFGFGFLFVGLGAITVGLAINMAYLAANDYLQQFTWLFVATSAWFALLWYPLKSYINNNHGSAYSNIKGSRAIIVDADLKKGEKGKAKWSGTTMVARIHEDSPEDLIKQGTEVIIVDIKGNTIYVR